MHCLYTTARNTARQSSSDDHAIMNNNIKRNGLVPLLQPSLSNDDFYSFVL